MENFEYLTDRELADARKESLDAGDYIQAAKYAVEISNRQFRKVAEGMRAN